VKVDVVDQLSDLRTVEVSVIEGVMPEATEVPASLAVMVEA
jgi:hypothetical protein